MAHVDTLARGDLPDLETTLARAEQTMGFVPNSMLTMAHMPQLTSAFSMLAGVVFGADLGAIAGQSAVPSDENASDNLPPHLVQLIAYSVSLSAGCRYCQAHTSHNAHRFGIEEAKLQEVLNFAQSELFDAQEKALIDIALAAGQVPNETQARHFEQLREHFNERQIVQVVGVISLFGFLNRWNDTMATQLEDTPVAFANEALTQVGWQVGKHA